MTAAPGSFPYLIIGVGAAGIAAAEAIRKHDPVGKILVVGEEPEGYYSRPGLAYYLSGEIPESQLFPFTAEDFSRRGITRMTGQVTAIQTAAHTVTLSNGQTLRYQKLLLATGASARGPRLPGGDLPGVVMLDSLAGTRQILKIAGRGKKAVVVGGGITALELVEGLHARGVQVHYFLRKDRYWANVLDEMESKIVEGRLQEDGVRIHYFTEIKEIFGKPSGLFGKGAPVVAGVRTMKDETIPCDLVGIAIGVGPRLELGKSAGLKIDRGIVVDDGMRTSEPDIYAAGDVAQVYDPLTNSTILDILWPTAREEGRVAGANMAGGNVTYHKSTALNVTRLAGLTTTIIGAVGIEEPDPDVIGIVRGDSETFRQVPDAIAAQSGFDVNHIRLMVGEKTLLGAIIMGDQSLSRLIQRLVEQQLDIRPIRAQLLQPQTNLGEIFVDFLKNQAKS